MPMRYASFSRLITTFLTFRQVFGARLNIVYLPHFALYLLSHVVELFVTTRYYLLLAVNRYVFQKKEDPILYPQYMMAGDLFKLQPGYVRIRVSHSETPANELSPVGLRTLQQSD